MAEASTESGDIESRRQRPPDKKQYEETIEFLNSAIKSKEAVYKSLNHQKGGDDSQHTLREIRSEKENTIRIRKQIDSQLSQLNGIIRKKTDELSKIQINLSSKNEDKINESIRRLETQLRTHNYNLHQEKRIVQEIDQLKRSKKSLSLYLTLKHEIDGMRDRQRTMREQRDHHYRKVFDLKKKEDELKNHSQSSRNKTDDLKKELDELYEQRRKAHNNYKRDELEWQDAMKVLRKQRHQEHRRRVELDRQTKEAEYLQQLADYEASREPYEDEKQLCLTLIEYLKRHQVESDTEAGHVTTNNQENSNELVPQNAAMELANEGMYILKKKEDDDDMMFGGCKKNSRKNKKDKRNKSFNKGSRPMVHAPGTLAQFTQLGLKAPVLMTEISTCIQQLKDKREYYEKLPPPTIQPSIHVEQESSASSAGAASLSESAIADSIPSTPEVMTSDAMPPLNRNGDEAKDDLSIGWPRLRRLSRDSGACEMEGPVEEPAEVNSSKSHSSSINSPSAKKQTMNSESSTVDDCLEKKEILHNDDLDTAASDSDVKKPSQTDQVEEDCAPKSSAQSNASSHPSDSPSIVDQSPSTPDNKSAALFNSCDSNSPTGNSTSVHDHEVVQSEQSSLNERSTGGSNEPCSEEAVEINRIVGQDTNATEPASMKTESVKS